MTSFNLTTTQRLSALIIPIGLRRTVGPEKLIYLLRRQVSRGQGTSFDTRKPNLGLLFWKKCSVLGTD